AAGRRHPPRRDAGAGDRARAPGRAAGARGACHGRAPSPRAGDIPDRIDDRDLARGTSRRARRRRWTAGAGDAAAPVGLRGARLRGAPARTLTRLAPGGTGIYVAQMGVAVRERPGGGAGMERRSQLFAVKPVEVLLAEMEGENRLRRVLGPVSLTALGVGAIIGAGIFVLTGLAAHDKAGPGLILSFVVAGIGCAFAGLCYAEFASMVPVAGRASTYAYATLGELFAWIIRWELVLEYAVASCTVAHGWSQYLLRLLSIFGVTLPERWTHSPIDVTEAYQFFVTGSYCNLAAALIVLLVTV